MKNKTPSTKLEKEMMEIFSSLSFGSRQKLVELSGMAYSAEQFALAEQKDQPKQEEIA